MTAAPDTTTSGGRLPVYKRRRQRIYAANDQGSVTVSGQAVTGPSPDRGILFQNPMLFPWLTTRKNVLFGRGRSGREASTSATIRN